MRLFNSSIYLVFSVFTVLNLISQNSFAQQINAGLQKENLKLRNNSFRIVETTTLFPASTSGVLIPQKAFGLPQRATASFGTLSDSRVISRSQAGAYELTNSLAADTVSEKLLSLAVIPVCGPSPERNVMTCFNLLGGELLDTVPLPGNLSTTPFFYDGSWFIGTSKGFFLRTEGSSVRYTPSLGGINSRFWGADSRLYMRALKDRLYPEATRPNASQNSQQIASNLPNGWKWYYATSSEYVGTPVVSGNSIIIQTAQQFLNSFDVNTGKLLWATRLAPESPLRLGAAALTATAREILVGTDEGDIIALNPKDGTLLWRYALPIDSNDKYHSIAAAPLVAGRSIIVSNAESQTQRVSLDGRNLEWSYPLGSVAQARNDEFNVYLGGSNGALAALDLRTGTLKWKTLLNPSSPLTTIFVVKDKKMLLVSTKKGQIFLVNAENGHIESSTPTLGDSLGEFFPVVGEADTCLTFVPNALRCFKVESTELTLN